MMKTYGEKYFIEFKEDENKEDTIHKYSQSLEEIFPNRNNNTHIHYKRAQIDKLIF